MKASASGRIHLLPLATLTLIVALVTVHPLSADGPIRVGIYPNEPLVFVDAEGQPAGFYIDLLEATATEEGWTLEYVECLFPDCLTLLEQGDLDLMTRHRLLRGAGPAL
jgi:ABC-type amino acid transport substrate-binding protein